MGHLHYQINLGTIFADYFCKVRKSQPLAKRSMGAVDYLDNFTIELFSKNYLLKMPSASSMIPVGQSKLDGRNSDLTISDNYGNWIEFVQKYYKDNGK